MSYRPLPAPVREAALREMEQLDVPGVAVGIWFEGYEYAEAFGVTSIDNPLPVTPETVFQIGSTSKTVTATAAMQLVEEGSLDLEARVRAYLPWFRLASEEDAARLTVRHLVTHHGGWAGDFFPDTGRGEDAIKRVVELMASSPQLVPAGTTFSYNNAGFHVLAHIVETIDGRPFDETVSARVFDPLGMCDSFYAPEEALTRRFAVGHVRTPAGPVVARPWQVARGRAGGGGVISNVPDQLRYARFHCGDGTTPAGRRLLQPETMAMMQAPQAEAGSVSAEIGIAWMLDRVGASGVLRVKHGGATNGQLSSFEMVPALGYACTVLTNSDSGRGPRDAVADAASRFFLGFGSEEPVPAELPSEMLASYAGRYEAMLAELDVVVAGDTLLVTERRPASAVRTAFAPMASPPARVIPVSPDRCVIADGLRRGERCEFLRDATGTIAWLRWDGRIARRLAE